MGSSRQTRRSLCREERLTSRRAVGSDPARMPHNRPVLAQDAASSVAALPDAEKSARFDRLQSRLVAQWRSIERLSEDARTIVVVPSLTGVKPGLGGTLLQAYEERFLFLLLL